MSIDSIRFRLSSQFLPRLLARLLWLLVWLLPVFGVLGGWALWRGSETGDALMFAGTLAAVWVAVLSGLCALRGANHQMLVELRRWFADPNLVDALGTLGGLFNEERRKLRSNNWQFSDNIGLQYIARKKRNKPEDKTLHSDRRQLSNIYDIVSSLAVHATIDRPLINIMFENLDTGR